MNLGVYIFCLVFGHNKILEHNANHNSSYYTTCTQCNKNWFDKKLKINSKFSNYSIKMRGHGKKIIIKIKQKEVSLKKQKVNFYTL